MKPAPFRYVRPSGIDDVLAALAEHGGGAALLAGGQSLLPMMNFRLARPSVLIDLGHVVGLDGMTLRQDVLTVGAMTRQARVASSVEVADRLGLLTAALRRVGHHQIRTRGTMGGSIAHADPAAELPAVARLLDARLDVRGPQGQRTIAAADFFQGPFTTALEDTELLTAIHLPLAGIEAWAFEELARRQGDFAIAGVAAAQVSGHVRLVGFGLGWVPQRLLAAESAVEALGLGGAGVQAAVEAARGEVDPIADVHAGAEDRRDGIAVLVERVLGSLRSMPASPA